MRIPSIRSSAVMAAVCAAAVLAGCASAPPPDAEYSQAQAAYTAASNSPKLAQVAPTQLHKASAALDQATTLRKNGASQTDVDHYAYLAIQQVAIARQLADAAASEAYVKQASAQRKEMLLSASRQQTEQARTQAQLAQMQQTQAQQQANASANRAQQARQKNADLRQQLAALHAKQTNRGIVLTLSNVLFATNKAELKPGAVKNLNKLEQFMQDNPKRNVMVEGYTDSTGNPDYNMQLSQRRADSVKTALVNGGVNAQRIVTKGFGEQYPVASNSTAAGRQQNRRVEIVISDANGNFAQSR